MTKLIRAALLVLVLFVCVQADDGIMQSGKTLPPPPPPTTATQSSEVPTEAADDGIIHTGVAETAMEVSLSLLQNLLAIF
jgi:hypothetical protein